MTQTTTDAYYMARALHLAEQGRYTTDPNPRVGCVLVKNQQIIGEGWHQRAGQAHAEINALNQVQNTTKGCTAYVTLEPCSHYGKTPPCCSALISAEVSRVVIAMQDPNPLVSGRGISALKQAGIEVECGLFAEQAQALNRGFIRRMTTGRPFVISKLAMSLDGRTALANGASQWISCEQARQDVQTLRAQSSAILTGINTVLADNPALTARVLQAVVQPIRVVLDSQLRMPVSAKMAQLAGETWVLTCQQNPQRTQELKQAGFNVFVLPAKGQSLDLNAVLDFLGQQQINTVLVEAGAILNGALLAEKIIDEYIIYLAPCILGNEGRGLFQLPSALQTMAEKPLLQLRDTRRIGTDLKLILSSREYLSVNM